MTGQLIMQLFRKTFKMKQIFFILLFVCFVAKGQVVPLGFISSVVEQKEVYFDTYVTIGSQKWLDHDLTKRYWTSNDLERTPSTKALTLDFSSGAFPSYSEENKKTNPNSKTRAVRYNTIR